MRVQEILGKDVHNMKARSLPCCLIKGGPNSGTRFEGGARGLGAVQGLPGVVQARWGHSGQGVWWGGSKKPEKRSGTVWLAYCAATSRILCRRFQ